MKKSTALRINQKIFYGWVIIFVAATSMFFSAPGQTFSISAFIDAYIKDYQFSRTSISLVYSVATLLSGVLLIIVGKFVDKFGQKFMLVLCGILLALSTFYNSFITTIPMMAMGFFLLRYFGQGSLTLIPSTLVPQWFERRRGIAFSIFKFGGAIASVVVPIMNVAWIRLYGWQWTWRIWSILLLVLFVPIMIIGVINTPEEIGLKPDNEDMKIEEIEAEALEIERESWHVKEAVKTRTFWVLGICTMLTPMITTGLAFHFFSIMAEKGIDTQNASYVLGLMGLPGFIFPFIAGYYMDKVKPKLILMVTLIIQGIALILLAVTTSIPMAIVSIMLFGVGMSSQFVASGVMWPNYFGRKYLGSIQAVATIFGVVGSAMGPLPFGIMFDLIGNYYLVLMILAFLAIIGGLFALYANHPTKKVAHNY
jgi:MFS family permease